MAEIAEQQVKVKMDKVIFSYKGNPASEMIDFIFDMCVIKLDLSEDNLTIRKRVIYVLLELLQNIFKHQEVCPTCYELPFKFYLNKTSEGYRILTENHVLQKNVKQLKKTIDGYVAMDTSDLNKKYRKILSNGNFNMNGGAGLGLIDIVRKTSGNLSYEFIPEGKESSLFVLNVNILAI